MFVNIQGINTHYVKEGTAGIPVVILPGWAANSSAYNLIIKQLSAKYTVYALDLPGFGKTPEPSAPWSLDEYAQFVMDFITACRLEEAILVGHSFGGRLIINLCNRALPFSVKKILLIDSAGIKNPLSPQQRKRQVRFKRLKRFYKNKLVSALFPQALDTLQKKYGSADYAAASPMMKQILVKTVSTDYRELLPNIQAEALLIWGEKDTATPLSDGITMHRLIPNSTLETVADAGHFPFIDQPFLFINILRKHFGLDA